jgi:hypothetical protein
MSTAETSIQAEAFRLISEKNWTIVLVGADKRPLGEWGVGGRNRYDYRNSENIYATNAPGIGVITGPSGLVIIDLDNDEAIKAWATRFGIPTTLTARTPRGRHLYYNAPPGTYIPPGTSILPGVDVRGGESYAVLPPSILHGAYEWANTNPIEDLPDNIINLLGTAKSERKKHIISGAKFDPGTRNDMLASMAGSMRKAGFDHSSISAAVHETNKTRCEPPLDIDEVDGIVDSVCRYEAGTPNSLDIISSLRIEAATLDDDDPPILASHASLLNTRDLVRLDPEPTDWVWEGSLAPGTLSMLHGEGGLGKSWIALKIAEQMLRDQGNLFDKYIAPGGVVILDGENAETQIHSRIHYTTITEDSDLHYYMVFDPILGLEELTDQYLEHIIEQHSPRLIIIDSQRALYAGDEKEQAEAGRMLRRFARKIEHHPCAYLFIHHDNRGGDYSGSSDINAAVTGCRLHLKRHTDKDKPEARIITQPKNRIAAELRRQEFLLNIRLQPRSHRTTLSGIIIEPYESDELVLRKQRLEQAMTLALNTSDGAAYRDIWAALSFDFGENGVSSTDQDKWKDLKEDLELQGFQIGSRGKLGGRVWKP